MFSGETSRKRDGGIFPFNERRSILSKNTLLRTLTLLRFAADGLFNKSLINEIRRTLKLRVDPFFAVVINVRCEKGKIY